ncbi:MAG TPA: CDP-glucose 4,6-dehydratase [Solirubrobacteraceae bacterium]
MIDPDFWRGRRVLVTGHTGFKGSWLSLWLVSLGAEVAGLSTPPPTEPSLYELARVGELVASTDADVRDAEAVTAAVSRARPEVIVHMAAQSLVRPSFAVPRETYEINVMGTVNVLEAARAAGDVGTVLVVTSDKCYENREWEWPYREDDPKGGFDPYSSSKACQELVAAAWRRSFDLRIATGRAGNVIGGGDWALDRLVPDAMRAALSGTPLRVRFPDAIRPWQHVLNPLEGYLRLIQAAWDDPRHADGFNFGPEERDVRPVRDILDGLAERWGDGLAWEHDGGEHPHEAGVLKLDSSRARARLGWAPRWDLETGLAAVIEWTKAYQAGDDPRATTLAQIEAFQGAEVAA